MKWTSFKESLPPIERPIIVAYAGDPDSDNRPDDTQVRWGNVEICVLMKRPFGHELLTNVARNQLDDMTLEHILESGKWCLVADFFAEVNIAEPVTIEGDDVTDYIEHGEIFLV